MKGYWIILGTAVSDEAAQQEYGRLWGPIGEKYQARLRPATSTPLLKEKRDTARIVVVEFPSLETAKACYDDRAYQDAMKFALKASKRDLIIFEGELA